MNKLALAISIAATLTMSSLTASAYFDDHNGTTSTDTTAVPSPYIGGQFGRTDLNYGSPYKMSINSVDDHEYGLRIYGGYAFSDFLAAEFGYDYYGTPNFKHKPTGNEQDLAQQGFDLSGKLSLPLNYGLGVYMKLGLAWIHRGNLNSNGGFFADKSANSKLTPLGGLGVSYSFNPQWAADLSWTRSMKNGDLPKSDFYALGLTYKFISNTADY